MRFLSSPFARGAIVLSTAAFLVACSTAGSKQNDQGYLQPVEQAVDPVAPMTLRVVGYGAPDERNKNLSAVQRRLLAIRASKVDAYRAMAERVYGMNVMGSSTVRDMVMQNDRFRTYVETYMYGARVVSADVMPDGSVETMLEMNIDQGFRNCLKTTDSARFNVDCSAPLAMAQNSGKKVASNNADGQNSVNNSAQSQRVKREAAIPDAGFYFIE